MLEPRGTLPLLLRGHVGAVNCVAYTPDGQAVLSGGADGTLRHWDATSGASEELLHGDAGAIQAIACAKASGQIALAGERLVLCQTELGVMTLGGHDGPVLSDAFSAVGALVASGGSDHLVRVWSASDGVELAKLEGQGGRVMPAAPAPVFGCRRWHTAPMANSTDRHPKTHGIRVDSKALNENRAAANTRLRHRRS